VKKLIALMPLIGLMFFSTAYAEMTPVNAKLLKEWEKGATSFSLRLIMINATMKIRK